MSRAVVGTKAAVSPDRQPARRRRVLAWIATAFLATLLFLPFFVPLYELSILEQALALAMFAVSLDLIWGVAGVLSFGHAAFFGLGAYALGLITRDYGFAGASYVGLAAAVIVPVVVAIGIGYFTFYGRVAGAYFAIITLAVSLILTQVATSWSSVTGGDNGLYPVPFLKLGIPKVAELAFDTEFKIYYLALASLIVVFVLSIAVVKSGFGQALIATESNDARAEFLGYDTRLLKLVVFAISAGIAGLGGGLYAPMKGFVSPSLLGLELSTQVIIFVALGGRGTLVGGILGALIIAFLSDYLSGTFVQVWLLLLGGFLLLVVLFRPQGLLGVRRVRQIMGTR